MLRDGGDGLAGDEEGDGEVAERRQVERDGIADDLGAGGDVDGGLAVEERGNGGALDGAAGAGEGDVGAADFQGCGAEGVAENDADAGAADGHVDDLAQGGVVGEVAVAVAWRRRATVDQVPTQWASELLALAEAVAMKGISSNDARKWRDGRRIVRAICCQVY